MRMRITYEMPVTDNSGLVDVVPVGSTELD
jgi:hypothetical protein